MLFGISLTELHRLPKAATRMVTTDDVSKGKLAQLFSNTEISVSFPDR